MKYKTTDVNQIADHLLIGNCRTAALVNKNGSVNWCCLPDFDSPAIFASLLDTEKGGFFSICPDGQYNSTQKYIPDTNVAETTFTTANGEVRLKDAFVVMSEEEKSKALFPDHELLRVLECTSGTVKMKINYAPELFYGKYPCALKDHKKMGIRFTWKENVFVLSTTLEANRLRVSENNTYAFAEFIIDKGTRLIFSLSCSCQEPAIVPELNITGIKRMEQTIRYWKHWVSNTLYKGPYLPEVKRSALVLKLLTYAPSGAIIAAPTTSLPEWFGGSRNWDYRYCWLRDASFTIRALLSLGFKEEAHAYMNWILHATRLTHPKLQVVYSVFGHAQLKEKKLSWLSGFRNSSPVRTGNGADQQFQLDVYGEVLDAYYSYSSLVTTVDKSTKKFLLGLGKVICKHWDQPDNGIWESRVTPLQYTHSKVMAWVGLDRLMKLCDKYKWDTPAFEKFKTTAHAIRDRIENTGYNKTTESYTRVLNGNTVDASLLTIPLVGYCNATSTRAMSTTRAIVQQLSKSNLLYRYTDDDGLSEPEGTFSICNFWLAENFARSGNTESAVRVFENTLKHANEAGLLSEQINPETAELLGNYPQAFTHIGLINAAMSIEKCKHQTVAYEYR